VHPLQLLLCQAPVWRIPCQAISHDRLQCRTAVATLVVRSKVRNQAKAGHCRFQLKITVQRCRGADAGATCSYRGIEPEEGLCAVQLTRRSCRERNLVIPTAPSACMRVNGQRHSNLVNQPARKSALPLPRFTTPNMLDRA